MNPHRPLRMSVATVLVAGLVVTSAPVHAASSTASTLMPTVPAAVQADYAGEPCEPGEGVTVVIDYGDAAASVEDPVVVSCAPGAQSSGLTALTNSGSTYTFHPRFPGFVCMINGAGSPSTCMSPGWTYWRGTPDGVWAYSSSGAGATRPAIDSVEGWRYQASGSTSLEPAVGPEFPATPEPDATAPTVVVDGPETVVEGLDAVYTVTVTDESEVESVQFRIEAGEWLEVVDGTFAVSGLGTGDHAVEVRATDVAGNTGTATRQLSVTPSISPVEFSDIEGIHFQSEIEWLSTQGITTGYDNGDGTFSYAPSTQVLREQMAAFLYRFEHAGGNPDPVEGPSEFVDVPANHVFKAHIAWLASTGITTGYDNGDGTKSYAPAAPVLREQMAAFLYRLAGSPEWEAPAVSPFSDLSTSHVFYDEITWLADTQITTGYDNGNGSKSFQGSAPVLREQMAAFLFRFNNLNLED